MGIEIKGPWKQQQIEDYLSDSRLPVRLGCVGGDGFPRVVSLWYQYREGALYCVTHRDSPLVSLLSNEPRVGFEVSPNEPPYLGVRGQGVVEMTPLQQREMLEALLSNYLGGLESKLAQWLLSRSEQEILITIQPRRFFSWDYRARMADIPSPA